VGIESPGKVVGRKGIELKVISEQKDFSRKPTKRPKMMVIAFNGL